MIDIRLSRREWLAATGAAPFAAASLRAQSTRAARQASGPAAAAAERSRARRLLLLADGLAPPRRRALRERRGCAPALRRLHPRPDPRADDELRQSGHPLVRCRLAARCEGMGVGADERDGLPAPARHPRQQ